MKLLIEAKEIANFKKCPHCGHEFLIHDQGDYLGRVYCLGGDFGLCDFDLEYVLFEEYHSRYEQEFLQMLKSG